MALPTIQPYWVKTFKNPAEISACQSQRKETFRSQWNDANKFFTKAGVDAQMKTEWMSTGSFYKSMNAADKLFSKASEKAKIEERRKKLSIFLLEESKQLEEEMKNLRLSNDKELSALKDRVEVLRSEKEERRKEVAQEKLYECWKKNEPALREVESGEQLKRVVGEWQEQKIEKMEAAKAARESERRAEQLMEVENLKKIELDRKMEDARKEQRLKMAEELREQMLELRRKEEEAGMLGAEEEKLSRHQRLLEEADEKRRRYEDLRRKKEFGRVLVRQYKEQLKKKSKDVQEALEFDLEILKELSAKEQAEQQLVSGRKEKMKADAVYMQRVIAEQLRLEKTREAELDMLYNDEAQRQWRRREAEWEQERLARERLMKSVLEERRLQIAEKMARVKKQHEESIEERERLLRHMEEHELLTRREAAEDDDRRKRREEEVKAQITSRETEREINRRKELLELDRKKAEQERYEKLLKLEAQKIVAQPPGPTTSFRRRKVAFE